LDDPVEALAGRVCEPAASTARVAPVRGVLQPAPPAPGHHQRSTPGRRPPPCPARPRPADAGACQRVAALRQGRRRGPLRNGSHPVPARSRTTLLSSSPRISAARAGSCSPSRSSPGDSAAAPSRRRQPLLSPAARDHQVLRRCGRQRSGRSHLRQPASRAAVPGADCRAGAAPRRSAALAEPLHPRSTRPGSGSGPGITPVGSRPPMVTS
jgi:hypothetical protein